MLNFSHRGRGGIGIRATLRSLWVKTLGSSSLLDRTIIALFTRKSLLPLKTPSLFEKKLTEGAPLAERLRPKTINDIIGQDPILGEQKPLRRFLEAKKLPSIILWGPPGCGKTTLARLLAKEVNFAFDCVSAIVGGVSDLKKAFETAKERKLLGQNTLLFVDEIHRFNRAQQDAFLPSLEDGTITLVGATTENPSFGLNAALLSRCHVLVLQRLQEEHLELLLQRAESFEKKSLPLTPESRQTLIRMADGDGRTILNFAESLFLYDAETLLTPEKLSSILQKRPPIYDKAQEGHYNLISALHKSVRGSDPDASLYWFCRMVQGGEDLKFIARRLIRMAVEDIGLADPKALEQAVSAQRAYDFLGSPEGELALAQCVVYLSMAPKSNAVYVAYKKALQKADETGSLAPPAHILNAPTQLMKNLGYGKGYTYDHDTESGVSGQNYFPDSMPRQTFYAPKGIGHEEKILKRLCELNNLRQQKIN